MLLYICNFKIWSSRKMGKKYPRISLLFALNKSGWSATPSSNNPLSVNQAMAIQWNPKYSHTQISLYSLYNKVHNWLNFITTKREIFECRLFFYGRLPFLNHMTSRASFDVEKCYEHWSYKHLNAEFEVIDFLLSSRLPLVTYRAICDENTYWPTLLQY